MTILYQGYLLLLLKLYGARQVKFRKWIELEEKKEYIFKAIKEGSDEFPRLLISFLSFALDVPRKTFLDVPWWITLRCFLYISSKSVPKIKIPILMDNKNKDRKKESWDYEGRYWHVYSHLLSKNYGWSLEYIAKLNVEEALSKIQEILIDEQLNKEFQWGMSEIAYPFDVQTKKSKFQPLPRPEWMIPEPPQPKKSRIYKSLMPQGLIDYSSIPEELRPKEIKQ